MSIGIRHLNGKKNQNQSRETEPDATWDIKLNMQIITNSKENLQKNLKINCDDKNRKRNRINDDDKLMDINIERPIVKRMRNARQPHNTTSPLGLIWDNMNYSCAYDALYTIFYHVWKEQPHRVESYTRNNTRHMQLLVDGFKYINDNEIKFEEIRNVVRHSLFTTFPNKYPIGKNNSNLDDIIGDMTNDTSYGISNLSCNKCGFNSSKPFNSISSYTYIRWSTTHYETMLGCGSIQQYIDLRLGAKDRLSKTICHNCLDKYTARNQLTITNTLWILPQIMIFAIKDWIDIDLSLEIVINGEVNKYILKGIIYLGNEHFTSRLIDDNGMIWYHDGITTKSTCLPEINISNLPNKQWLKTVNRNMNLDIKEATVMIYIKC